MLSLRGRVRPSAPSLLRLLMSAVVAGLLVACGTGEEPAPEVDEPGDEAPQTGEEPAVAEDDPAEAGASDAGEPSLLVVATVSPIADLVRQVGGDRVEVESLVPAGGDAHTYEPQPQDVVVLSDADAYFGIGLHLNDGALALAEENLADDAPLVRLGELTLDDVDLVFDHDHGDDAHSHGDEEGHSHGDEEGGHSHGDEEGGHSHGEEEGDHSHGEEESGHSHGDEEGGHSHGEEDGGHSHGDEDDGPGPNPHVWTSLRNAAALVEGIEATLAELDPDGADHYAENAEAYLAELAELDELILDATSTIPGANRTLVTYHDAWTYFARDYDLDYATAVQPADFSEPSASEVRDVIDLIRELEVPVVFGSEVFPTPVLETIAEETGAEYVADLSDDVLPGEAGSPEHTYLELMRRNAHAIVDALGGDASELE